MTSYGLGLDFTALTPLPARDFELRLELELEHWHTVTEAGTPFLCDSLTRCALAAPLMLTGAPNKVRGKTA